MFHPSCKVHGIQQAFVSLKLVTWSDLILLDLRSVKDLRHGSVPG